MIILAENFIELLLKDYKTLEDTKVFFTYDVLPFEETIEKSLNSSDKITNVLSGVDPALFLKGHHHLALILHFYIQLHLHHH